MKYETFKGFVKDVKGKESPNVESAQSNINDVFNTLEHYLGD